jgi:hypothetical protein
MGRKRTLLSIVGCCLTLAGLLPAAYSQPGIAQGAPSAMDGKKVLVRVYAKGSSDAKKYDSRELEIQNGNLTLPDDKDCALLVVGSDQTDASVAEVVGQSVRFLPPAPGSWRLTVAPPAQTASRKIVNPDGSVTLTSGAPGTPNQSPNVFLADALGQPLPAQGTRVTFLLSGGADSVQTTDLSLEDVYRVMPAEELQVNSDGAPLLPVIRDESTRAPGSRLKGYLVSHPDYGTALVKMSVFAREGMLRVPLVARGTPARERALTGQVVTPQGLPVPEAVVGCQNLWVGGRGIQVAGAMFAGAEVVSDTEGRFALYPIDMNPKGDHRDILPLHARFTVSVGGVPRLELLPCSGEYDNAEPARIVMDSGDAFHTFAFDGPSGRVGDLSELGTLRVTRRKSDAGARPSEIPREILEKGGKTPYAIYSAEATGKDGKRLAFAPVTVDASSPQEIVFSLPKGIEYHSRVIDGATGTPLAGAFVIGTGASASDRPLCDLTADQWQAMHTLPAQPELADKALEPLRQIYRFVCITRTDTDGYWTLTAPAGESFYFALAFDEGFLPFASRLYTKKPDAESDIGVAATDQVTIPDMKTYRSARVTITPVVGETAGKQVTVTPRWVIAPEANPEWTADLISWVDGSLGYQGEFAYEVRIKPDSPTNVEVPAGLHLKVRIRAASAEEIGGLVIPTDICLQPGQTLDLGRQQLPAKVPVILRVTDESGKPLEGMPLRVKANRAWSLPHSSDKDGSAQLFVQPGEETVVGVTVFDRETRAVKDWTVPAAVTGKEEQPPVFTLKLPEEAIKKAFLPPY